jgi:hypothetical protein
MRFLIPRKRALLEKLIVSKLVKTRRLTTVFIGTCHWSLSWARWVQSKISHPVSWRLISHSRLCHLQIFRLTIVSHVRRVCHVHLIFFKIITLIMFSEEHTLRNSAPNILHFLGTSSVSDTNILSTLYWNTNNARDQVSRSYENTGRIVVSCIFYSLYLCFFFLHLSIYIKVNVCMFRHKYLSVNDILLFPSFT